MKRGVRLSSGRHRGRTVPVPAGVRPTEGRVREALFSIWGERVADCRFLDLFAGSGAVALEALSRGALEAVGIEADPRTLRRLQESAESLGERGALSARRGTLPEALRELRERNEVFDLIFADPPYAFGAYEELLLAVEPLLAADGEIAVEHAARLRLPPEVEGLVQVDHRRYGESALSFYRHLPRSTERDRERGP